MGDISTGFTSDFVTGGTPQLDSTFVAGGSGTTNDFEFFARGAGNTQNFTPEIYAVANGQKGGLLGTGSTITVPKGADGKWYVSSLSGVALTGGSSYVLALDPQDVHNGTYVGAETNGTISEFVDYSTSGTQSSQRLAAGKAATNLKTETTWPGAQDPPYVCCWNQQGQFVTFTFTVPAGETTFVLRYSAGAGPAKRKIELDGSVLAAAETFPATAGWSTWSTVSLNQQLAAGTHTLKVWFDTTAGSTQWLNLDNLTVSQSRA
jgi:hypothetical protein